MRNAFAAEITERAAEDRRIVLLSGDIGNRLFDPFKASFPERFHNCGVAEANMVGVSAGLALSGFRPVLYTIAPFITARCFEQVKLDLCYHHLPVVVVGVGGGLSYASLGGTHHSFEDIALLRALPGMTVVCPGDPVEVRLALRAALSQDGPVYIRLGKKGEPVVHKNPPAFSLGRGIVVRTGTEVCLLSTGNLLPHALTAAEELAKRSVSTSVVSMHTAKPLDDALLEEVAAEYRLVVTLEEHSLAGGFGGAVAEWMADRRKSVPLLRLGMRDEFLPEAGGQTHGRRYFGLSPEQLCERIAAEARKNTTDQKEAP